MEKMEFTETFKERCAAIDKMLCEVVEYYITIKDLTRFLGNADMKLQVNTNKILVEGFRHKVLKIVVALEDLEGYVKRECDDPEQKMSLLAFLDLFLEKTKDGCEHGSEFLEELEEMGKGGTKCEE